MRMLNLRDVLELVNHGLDDRAFASEQLIVQLHLYWFFMLRRGLSKNSTVKGSADK